MQVYITDLATEMALGTKGVIFHIWDDSSNLKGKLRISKATVEFCEGKTRIGNGKKIHIDELLNLIKENGK